MQTITIAHLAHPAVEAHTMERNYTKLLHRLCLLLFCLLAGCTHNHGQLLTRENVKCRLVEISKQTQHPAIVSQKELRAFFRLVETTYKKDLDEALKMEKAYVLQHGYGSGETSTYGYAEIGYILYCGEWPTMYNCFPSHSYPLQDLHIPARADLARRLQGSILKAYAHKSLDINNTSSDDRTALMFAAALGNKELIKWLVEHGVDTQATHWTSGFTALHYAALYGNRASYDYLISLGSDPGTKDLFGRRAEDYFSRYRTEPIHKGVWTQSAPH